MYYNVTSNGCVNYTAKNKYYNSTTNSSSTCSLTSQIYSTTSASCVSCPTNQLFNVTLNACGAISSTGTSGTGTSGTVGSTPTGGVISVNPSTGIAFNTTFTINTSNWIGNSPFTYRFGYYLQSTDVGNLAKITILQSWSTATTLTTQLPIPLSGTSLYLSVECLSNNNISKLISTTVTVTNNPNTTTLPVSSIVAYTNNLLNNNSTMSNQQIANSISSLAISIISNLTVNTSSLNSSDLLQLQTLNTNLITTLVSIGSSCSTANNVLDPSTSGINTLSLSNNVLTNAAISSMAAFVQGKANCVNETYFQTNAQTPYTNTTLTNLISIVGNLYSYSQTANTTNSSSANSNLSTVLDILSLNMVSALPPSTPFTISTPNLNMTVMIVNPGLQTALTAYTVFAASGAPLVTLPVNISGSSSNYRIDMRKSSINPYSQSTPSNVLQLNSAVFSLSIKMTNNLTEIPVANLSFPVVMNLEVNSASLGIPNVTDNFDCRYWDKAALIWSTYGCTKIGTTVVSGVAYVQCSCNHLTDFALISTSKTDSNDDSVIIAVGIVFAVLALIAIAVALWCNNKRYAEFRKKTMERIKRKKSTDEIPTKSSDASVDQSQAHLQVTVTEGDALQSNQI
jgi:hypothetical protein